MAENRSAASRNCVASGVMRPPCPSRCRWRLKESDTCPDRGRSIPPSVPTCSTAPGYTPPIHRFAPDPALADVVRRYWMPVWSLPPGAGIGAAGAAVPRLPDRGRRRLRAARRTGDGPVHAGARGHRLGARHDAPARGRSRAGRRERRPADRHGRSRLRRPRASTASTSRDGSARRSATTRRPRPPGSGRRGGRGRAGRTAARRRRGAAGQRDRRVRRGRPGGAAGRPGLRRSSRSPSAPSSGSPPAGSGCRRSG